MARSRVFLTAIVEDEPLALNLLGSFAEQRTELRVVWTAKDGLEALSKLEDQPVDLLLLDVDLPQIGGFEILEKLGRMPYVIFTTAFTDRAVDAFEVGAIDYIVKPVQQARFKRAVDRALSFLAKTDAGEEKPQSHGLFVAEKGNRFLVPFAEIIYAASHENYCTLHTPRRDYATYATLKSMEERLPVRDFTRIHKQFIVSIRRILRVQSDESGAYTVFLDDEDETALPVGRTFAARLKGLMR